MPDSIGNISVPAVSPSGTFPIQVGYPYTRIVSPEVAVHQFDNPNTSYKTEQRFYLGSGLRKWIVQRPDLSAAEESSLISFWAARKGAYQPFTFAAPNGDGTTTNVTARFLNEPLTLQKLTWEVSSTGVTLVELSTGNGPTYSISQTASRIPPSTLNTALLDQVQEIIPLLKIQPKKSGYPAIYLSDRRCTVGGQLYQARLDSFSGIQQTIKSNSDSATFTFGNADRVMRSLANDVDLFRASIEFSLFHVATTIKLDLWKGEVTDWSFDEGPIFQMVASDGLYELRLPYPTRKVSRTCWKDFNDGLNCPAAANGGAHLTDPCDKGLETAKGCRYHNMVRYFGGIIAQPQGVSIKDNSTGKWGFNRSTITSVSIIQDSIYDQVIPEVYTESRMPVNCKIAAGRDESDFYTALGVVCEGPIGAFATSQMIDNPDGGQRFSGHTLDGQPHHGFGTAQPTYGLRTNLGADPAPNSATNRFGLSSVSADPPEIYAAGTAFLEIRRSDAKGIQYTSPTEHAMVAMVQSGMGGWTWSDADTRVWTAPLVNPVWIRINALLRAKGLRAASASVQKQYFDVDSAIAVAAICQLSVNKLVGSGTETQFRYRGTIQEEKPLRDWIEELENNYLGYNFFSFGKLVSGIRINSSTVSAFTVGNILKGSLRLEPKRPTFNHITAQFADEEFDYALNSVTVYDIDHAKLIGGATSPQFLKANINLQGTFSKSQAARIITTRLREELGGITEDEWKKARKLEYKTTVLALEVQPGDVCSLTQEDMPDGAGEFRVQSWRLNSDYSIDISGETTTDSMYDLTAGPKPADVQADPLPSESPRDYGSPGTFLFTPALYEYGTFSIENASVQDNVNIRSMQGAIVNLIYVDELTSDVFVTLDNPLTSSEDPATITVTPNPNQVTAEDELSFAVGDFIVFNDPGKYEVAQITAISGSNWTIQRHYPGTSSGKATFESFISAHDDSTQIFKCQIRQFNFDAKSGNWNTASGFPDRFDCNIPSAAVVAVVASVYNLYGFSDWTVYNCSGADVPGLRTLAGGNYTFQSPGTIAVQDQVVYSKKVQFKASLRVAYATLGIEPTGSAATVKFQRSRDNGSTWEDLTTLTIAAGETLSYDPNTQIPSERRIPFGMAWPTPILFPEEDLNISITGVGSTTPGEDLSVEVFT